MDYLQIISVPAIATIVYWTINLIKYAVKENEIFMRLIPLLSAAMGGILGIVCYYLIPEIISASNLLVAIISGGASGLSATGYNQIIKQISKNKVENIDNKDDTTNNS